VKGEAKGSGESGRSVYSVKPRKMFRESIQGLSHPSGSASHASPFRGGLGRWLIGDALVLQLVVWSAFLERAVPDEG